MKLTILSVLSYLSRISLTYEKRETKKDISKPFLNKTQSRNKTNQNIVINYQLMMEKQRRSLLRRSNGNIIEIYNRWIVPYNPVSSRIFNYRINLPLSNSIKTILIPLYITCTYVHIIHTYLYIFSYINKKPDPGTTSILCKIL